MKKEEVIDAPAVGQAPGDHQATPRHQERESAGEITKLDAFPSQDGTKYDTYKTSKIHSRTEVGAKRRNRHGRRRAPPPDHHAMSSPMMEPCAHIGTP